MKKINNKGFVISSILYTLLISFLLMLALLLLQFKSSSDVINNASKDLVNGEEFKATQVLLDGNIFSYTDSATGNIIKIDGTDTSYSYYDYNSDNYKNVQNGTPLTYKCVSYGKNELTTKWIQQNGTNIGYISQYYLWFDSPNQMLVRINSRYGTMYWPKDFSTSGVLYDSGTNKFTANTSIFKNIKISLEDDGDASANSFVLRIEDTNNTLAELKNGINCSSDGKRKCFTISIPDSCVK